AGALPAARDRGPGTGGLLRAGLVLSSQRGHAATRGSASCGPGAVGAGRGGCPARLAGRRGGPAGPLAPRGPAVAPAPRAAAARRSGAAAARGGRWRADGAAADARHGHLARRRKEGGGGGGGPRLGRAPAAVEGRGAGGNGGGGRRA